jgi:hypothetical protein
MTSITIDEVPIRVLAAPINSRDWRPMRANPYFIHLVPRDSATQKQAARG